MNKIKDYFVGLKIRLQISAVLSILWTLFSMAYITYASFFDVPKENLSIVNNTLGFIFGVVVGSILNFWFGAKEKEKEIELKNE